MKLGYPFLEQDMLDAYEQWGCNCGPGSLAFALQVPLVIVHGLIPGFDEKKYTSPSMMAAALDGSGCKWSKNQQPDHRRNHPMFSHDCPTLVRVQWTGPWTAPDAHPRWSYKHTHWVCAWNDESERMIFDINGGIRTLASWENEVIPPLLESCVPRADGGWYETHCWRVYP